MKPPGEGTSASIRSRLPGSSGTTAAWIMGGSRLARRRNVLRQIEPLTSTVRLRTARRHPDLDSADPEAWTSRRKPARLHWVPVDRPAAVGVRSITSDLLQIRHHRDRDRHRYKPRRAVHWL